VLKFGPLLDYADNKKSNTCKMFASYYKNQSGKNEVTELPDHNQEGLCLAEPNDGAAPPFDFLQQ
jgi:hypothetical protein